MYRSIVAYITGLLLVAPAAASEQAFIYPSHFRTQQISSNGTVVHVRIGGKGPAVLLLHGYGETGDMWAPLAAELSGTHTVIAPDLRGMGLSARAEKGFEKKNQAEDIAGVINALHITKVDVIAHDIGNMVAFAFAAQYPETVTRLVSLNKRFVSRVSQISGREFVLVVPGVEGSFGGANGSGDGKVGIGCIG